MKEELYRKVYVKSKADLPKGTEAYLSHSTSGHVAYRRFVPAKKLDHATFENISGEWWMRNIDWYLQPIEQKDEDDNEFGPIDLTNVEPDILTEQQKKIIKAVEQAESKTAEEIKCHSCVWFKIGYGHCNWCVHSKQCGSFQDNYMSMEEYRQQPKPKEEKPTNKSKK